MTTAQTNRLWSMKNLGQFAKAIYAFVVAGLSSIATVLINDASLGDLTDGQWVTAVLAAIVAGGGVYLIPNAPKERT